jgi:hypothetical protein
MSRANNRLHDLEELNRKLEQTIQDLHGFASQLAGLGDKRETSPVNKNSTERPRAAFLYELDGAVGALASNLGYLDGLVSNLYAEVFGEHAPPPAPSSMGSGRSSI